MLKARVLFLFMVCLVAAGCKPAAQGPSSLGGLIGGGASPGGASGLLGSVVSEAVSSVMQGILNSLTADEKKKRDQAMRNAAQGNQGSSTGWTSSESSTPTASSQSPNAPKSAAPATKQAKYVNKGKAKNGSGQVCTRVAETIIMPDGTQGTSESLVCPS